MEAKQGHVRLVIGLLIPFSFLLSASYLVYAFWSLIQVLLIFKAQPSALRWNHQLYDIVAYVYECTSKADEFIRTVGLILCKPVYHLFRITLIIEQILEAEATI